MARPEPFSNPWSRRTTVREAGVIAGSALMAAALFSGVAGIVALTTQLRPSFPAVAVLAALLGVMAAPPVRLPLERHDAAGRGAPVVLAGMLIGGALVAAMGLAVLVAATSVGTVAHAVQVRPTPRQILQACTMAVVVTTAAWAAQAAGVVEAFIDPRHSAVLMLGLLALMTPVLLNAADIARRATRAADQLEEERRLHLAQLQHAAAHDSLTGLLSRRGLTASLHQAAEGAGPASQSAVLFIDLDGFKKVNDVHGHDAGDALLQELGARLLGALRPADRAGRIGGDEFVVVMTDLPDPTSAHALAGRVQVALEAPVLLPDGSQVGVGASIGVAVRATGGTAAELMAELMAEADAAMYLAKRARRAQREGVRTS